MKQTTNHQNPNFEQLPMQINVKIYRPSVKGPILADASVNLNGCFAIRGVQVKEGRNGPFVSMPSRQVKGEYRGAPHRLGLQAGAGAPGTQRREGQEPVPAPADETSARP